MAKDGVEALKALAGGAYDLLLLDVWMPRMNGLDLLAKLRTAKQRPRGVVMTSDDAPRRPASRLAACRPSASGALPAPNLDWRRSEEQRCPTDT